MCVSYVNQYFVVLHVSVSKISASWSTSKQEWGLDLLLNTWGECIEIGTTEVKPGSERLLKQDLYKIPH